MENMINIPHQITVQNECNVQLIENQITVQNECNEHLIEDNKMDIQDSIINTIIIKTEHSEECEDDYMEDIKPTPCQSCGEFYEWFCLNCSMLVNILDNIMNTNHTPQNTIPKIFFEIKHLSDDVGVFTKKNIPKGVIFGPFYGLNLMPLVSNNAWKFNGTKFVDINIEETNWMQYIKCIHNKCQCNLTVFQYGDNLYYETNRIIEIGEELLWYCDEAYVKKLRNTTICYEAVLKEEMPDIYACTHCCLGFSSSIYLEKHKMISPFRKCKDLQEIVQCAFCKIYLDQKEYMNYHMTYCCEKQSRKLLMAAAVFNTKPKVRKKKSKKQKRDCLYKKYLCPKCAYSTKYLSNLFQHNLVHTQEKKFTCKDCDYKCNKKQNLQLHEQNKHSVIVDKKFKCPICPFQTSYQSSIKNHAIIHEDIRPDQSTKLYNCTQCSFVTKYKGNLITHNLNHNLDNKQIFTCKDCDYACVTKQNFQLHLKRIHLLDAETFKCSQCTYETIYKQNLKNHFIVHTKTKQYQCEKCEFSTKYKNSFEKHNRNQHDMKRFSCKICDYTHNKRASLRAHVKKLHLDVADNADDCIEDSVEMCESAENRVDENYFSDKRLSLHAHVNKLHLNVAGNVEDCIDDSVEMCQSAENRVEGNDFSELIGCDFETLINPV